MLAQVEQITMLGLGRVPFTRHLLAKVVGEVLPTVLSPGSAAMSACLYGPVLGGMWTSD